MTAPRTQSHPIGILAPGIRAAARMRVPRGARASMAIVATLALTVLGGASPVSARAADACPNAQFRTGPSAQLPDCRAYELVTPADKQGQSPRMFPVSTSAANSGSGLGASAFLGGSSVVADPNGERVFVSSEIPFGVGESGRTHSVARRTAHGWQSASLRPPLCSPEPYANMSGDNSAYQSLIALSERLDRALFSVGFTASGIDLGCEPDDQAGVDVYQYGANGSQPWDWVSRHPDGSPKTANVTARPLGLSADGTHALFSTPEKLLPVDAARQQGDGLYDRVGGQTRAVGVKTDGSLVNPCGAAGVDSFAVQWPVSRDNRVILFTSGLAASVAGCKTTDGGGQLYARIDGNRTVHLSASTRSTPDPMASASPVGATADGRHVFFVSTARLVDDSDGATPGGGLYEYDLSPVLDGTANVGTLRFLSPSVDGNPADVSAHEPINLVNDGDTVFFVARGKLTGNAPATSAEKLYRATGGAVDLAAAREDGGGVVYATSQVSENGRFVAFNDRRGTDTYPQIYRTDLQTRETVCVSCPPVGTPQTAAARFWNIALGGGPTLRFGNHSRLVSNDGRVVFSSHDRLASGDADGLWDVYEYRSGQRALLSPGTDSRDALLLAASNDLESVFFGTGDSLVAADFDDGDRDVYVAREGGGFPDPPVAATCVGDACQGSVAAPGPSLVAGTPWFSAPEALVDTPTPVSAGKVSVKRPKTVRTGTKVRLSVKTPEAGRIRVSGSGLMRAKKTAKKAKTYRVTVKLSKRSKRILKRKHRVTVRATVRFTPKRGKRSRSRVHVTFKAKDHDGKAKKRSHDRGHRSAEKGGR